MARVSQDTCDWLIPGHMLQKEAGQRKASGRSISVDCLQRRFTPIGRDSHGPKDVEAHRSLCVPPTSAHRVKETGGGQSCAPVRASHTGLCLLPLIAVIPLPGRPFTHLGAQPLHPSSQKPSPSPPKRTDCPPHCGPQYLLQIPILGVTFSTYW